MVIYYIGHVDLRPYVYSFWQIFQALRLFPALRLFWRLEYSTLGETDRFCFKILIYFLNTLKIAFHEIFQIFEHYSVSKCFTILRINALNIHLLTVVNHGRKKAKLIEKYKTLVSKPFRFPPSLCFDSGFNF